MDPISADFVMSVGQLQLCSRRWSVLLCEAGQQVSGIGNSTNFWLFYCSISRSVEKSPPAKLVAPNRALSLKTGLAIKLRLKATS